MLRARSKITMTATAFWNKGSFAEHVLREISRPCVDIKTTLVVLDVYMFTNTLNNGPKPKAH